MTSRAMFITVEGGEGSGKSSLIHHLVEWFAARSVPVLQTREPGGTPIAEDLRNLLLHARAGRGMLPLTELLIVLAARVEHVEKVVRPALASGTTVVCDRYIDSTMAYQAFGRRCPPERVWGVSVDVVPLLPDLTFYLDVDPKTAFGRVQKRQQEARDRLEAEDLHFHERVREGFLTMARRCPERVVVLDAALSESALAARACEILGARLSCNRL
jgi:dTMP kinase